MNDYTPNSYKFKEEKKAAESEKRASKVVRGAVKTKKKSGVQKFADVFIKEDVANVKKYIIDDIVIPTIRDTIWSVFTNSLEMFLYPSGSRGRRSRTGADYVSYRDYSDRERRRESRWDPDSRPRFDGDDLVFETRGDAEAVLDEMHYILKKFGLVRVGDLYDMADRTAPFTANDYGWTSLNRVDIVHVRDGYILRLPKALPID